MWMRCETFVSMCRVGVGPRRSSDLYCCTRVRNSVRLRTEASSWSCNEIIVGRFAAFEKGALMTPMDAYVARANVARMRVQLTTSVDAETQATLQRLLEEQLEALRVGEAWEDSK